MDAGQVEREYKESLAWLAEKAQAGENIQRGYDDTTDKHIDNVARFLQIKAWRERASSAENGEDIYQFLTSYDIESLMDMVGMEINAERKEVAKQVC